MTASSSKPHNSFRRKITVDPVAVPAEAQENFPLLIELHDPALRSAAHGGHVADAGGRDIGFTGTDGSLRLIHQVERYDPAAGVLRAWVRLPAPTQDGHTELYIHYGAAGTEGAAPPSGVWDDRYLLVMHLQGTEADGVDATAVHQKGSVRQGPDGSRYIRVSPSRKVAEGSQGITVEAWVEATDSPPEVLQTLVSQWGFLSSFDSFAAYDAGNTDGLKSRGYFGAAFDGRYVYFAPQHDGEIRHGKVLRYDTSPAGPGGGDFNDPRSWRAYDAGHTSGMSTKGYYGAIAAGRYVYFIPRHDGSTNHCRLLRYDSSPAGAGGGDFSNPNSWQAYQIGTDVSYQSAAYDGRYLYLIPGYEGEYLGPGREGKLSGKFLRYDTHQELTDPHSYTQYDASNTSGFVTQCYDGAVFDGRYVYFAPLDSVGLPLRYDTQRPFTASDSWTAFDGRDIGGLHMGKCVGAVFDGRYVYYVPYLGTVVARYDIRGDFTDPASWSAVDIEHISGMQVRGYDGGIFDGKYVYFIPFWAGNDSYSGFHAKTLRYDTQQEFTSPRAWTAYDAENTSGIRPVGFNGGAFDGRFMYFAPWREGTDAAGNPLSIGRVLRYDTTGSRAAFSLRYTDYGHNGGLGGALPGPGWLVNTPGGILNVRANRALPPGHHHLAGVYDGQKLQLYIDGALAAEQPGRGEMVHNQEDILIGRLPEGLGYFTGRLLEVRISQSPRSADWIRATYQNLSHPESCVRMADEE